MNVVVINVWSAVYNWVSQQLWFINWRIWWMLAKHLHEKVYIVELQYDLVKCEIIIPFLILAVFALIKMMNKLEAECFGKSDF